MTALHSPFDVEPLKALHQHPRPSSVPGAEWQAGRTPGNETKRVLLDGEPQPLAFAASYTGGWVMVFCDPQHVGEGVYRIPKRIAFNPATHDGTAYRRLVGYVQIVDSRE